MALSNPFFGESLKKAGAYFEPLRVSAQDIPNMTVKIAAGGYMLNDNVVIEFVGGNSPTFTAPGSNAKWVFVTLKTNGTIELLNGTASVAPAQPTVPVDGRLILAAVFVNAGTTAITNAMINDARPIFSSGSTLNHVSVLNRNHIDAHDIASITDLQDELDAKADVVALALKADIDGTINEVFTLNKDFSGTPSANAVLAVERGGSANVDIRWNEGTDMWEFTNDGSTYAPVGMGAGTFYTVAQLDGAACAAGAKINKVCGVLTAGTIPTLLMTGELALSAVLLADVALTANHYTKAQNDGLAGAAGAKTDKVVGAVAGNFAGLNAAGNLTDSGFDSTDFAAVAHTHTASQITDFNTAWTARHNLASIDGLADVVIAGPVLGEFLRWNGSNWVNIALVKSHVTDFVEADYVHIAGPEVVTGDKTFSGISTFNGNVSINGTVTTLNAATLNVSDEVITLNADHSGPPTSNAGLLVERGTSTDASFLWNETVTAWQAGLLGSEVTISLVGHTHIAANITDFTEAAQDAVAAAFAAGTHVGVTVTYDDVGNSISVATTATEDHPDYNLFSAVAAQTMFVTTFTWTAPAANKAAVTVFVNGLKQVEGVAKDFTAVPGTITFNAGLLLNDDVEVYGYG